MHHDFAEDPGMVGHGRILGLRLANEADMESRWEIATAALRSGVIICPCTTLLVDKDIEYRVQVSGATVFVGDETSVRKVLKVKSKCPTLKHLLQIGGTIPEESVDFRATLSKVAEGAVFEPLDLKPKDPSLIFFTSGTTGPPKMVLHNQISYPLGKSCKSPFCMR
jgi:medium-chain acyl-CoA synthetase